MARNRAMLDKKISVSEQVSNLPVEAQLIFTWSIPHADDGGFLPYPLKTIKASVVPMWDIDLERFTELWNKIINEGLIKEVEVNGQKFWFLTKFLDNQTFRRDIQPSLIVPFDYEADSKKSWENLDILLKRNGTGRNVTEWDEPYTKLNKRKEKKRKENNICSYTQEFEKFWLTYPKKVGKGKAFDSWQKVNPNKKLIDIIIKAVGKQKNCRQWLADNGQYIPHPTTWLNQKRWDDEVEVEIKGKQTDKF